MATRLQDQCVHTVSIQCVHTVCPYSVSIQCVHTVCSHSVYSLQSTVSTVCPHRVSIQCVYTVCPYSVSIQCVQTVCPHGCKISVSIQCVSSLQSTVSTACLQCVHTVSIQCVHTVCPYEYIQQLPLKSDNCWTCTNKVVFVCNLHVSDACKYASWLPTYPVQRLFNRVGQNC